MKTPILQDCLRLTRGGNACSVRTSWVFSSSNSVCFRSFPCIAVRDFLQSIVLGKGEKIILNKKHENKNKITWFMCGQRRCSVKNGSLKSFEPQFLGSIYSPLALGTCAERVRE